MVEGIGLVVTLVWCEVAWAEEVTGWGVHWWGEGVRGRGWECGCTGDRARGLRYVWAYLSGQSSTGRRTFLWYTVHVSHSVFLLFDHT